MVFKLFQLRNSSNKFWKSNIYTKYQSLSSVLFPVVLEFVARVKLRTNAAMGGHLSLGF